MIGDGQKDQVGHELHYVAGREVLSGLFIVLFVESPDEFLEDRAHRVVVESGDSLRSVGVQNRKRPEVDRAVQKLLNEATEYVGIHKGLNLVAELELVEDLLDVRREAIEVSFEVCFELLESWRERRSRNVSGELLPKACPAAWRSGAS